MKKAIFILLSLVLALSLIVGCGGAASDGVPAPGDLLSFAPADSMPAPAAEAPAEDSWLGDFRLDDEDWRYVPFDETDEFAVRPETPFKDVLTSPLSTFSVSVDTASYSIMRRQIMQGMEPNGLRIEELINYFDYSHPAPGPYDEHPFTITTEISESPWSPGHLLAMVAVQGVRLQNTEEIRNNIVFLIDVSGSMDRPDRLPLVKESMILLMNQLGDNDVISIVTYAGSEQVLADSVPGTKRHELVRIVENLRAGGSTAGAQALRMSYEIASKNFIEGGNNRIILATDGDFNVGESSVDALMNLVETERDRGVFISVLGYGMGNLKDNRMEAIASNGNGNYAYIDTIQEAKKVLVDEFDSTMFVIAKDVKIQVEFNPETISAYRLIGYETRRLENEDFNNDSVDAGDIGSGHNVTAFFELIPVGTDEDGKLVDNLRYSNIVTTGSGDFMTVKVRYKTPDGHESKLVEHVLKSDALNAPVSDNFRFASAVAEFGLIVTDSSHRGNSSLDSAISRASASLGEDAFGLRAEFIDLINRHARNVNW